MASADHIIQTLGGSAAISRATGFPLTTIESWKDANFIPEWRQAALLDLAKDEGKRLRTDDFPTVADRKSRRHAAEQGAAA